LIVTVGRQLILSHLESMAGTTGLEPATSAVTGQHSNQLNYVPKATFLFRSDVSRIRDSSDWLALTTELPLSRL
jgi:hypothetical protein